MSNIPNTNTFNNVNSNTPFNDMAYKLDQVLGMGRKGSDTFFFDLFFINKNSLHFHCGTEFVQTQACQISELRNALEMKNNADDNKLKAISKNIEFSLSKTIEDYLIRYEREHKKKLDAFVAERYVTLHLHFPSISYFYAQCTN